MNTPAFFAWLQQATLALMETRSHDIWQIGFNLARSFAVLQLVWLGFEWLFAARHHDWTWSFVKQMLYIAFGLAMLVYYDSPILGSGPSFSHLIPDQTSHLSRILDSGAVIRTYVHLDQMFNRFVPPNGWQASAALAYGVLTAFMYLAKIVSLAVVMVSLIATAMGTLVGPIFVSFFLLPPLDFIFWTWLKGIIAFAFVQVFAYAYFAVFESYIFNILQGLPPGITYAQYPEYLGNVVVGVGVFIGGIVLVPVIAMVYVGGSAGHSAFDRFVR